MSDLLKGTELAVVGNYMWNGTQVEGVKTTTWRDEFLINGEVLTALLIKKARCEALEKSSGHLMNLIKAGALSNKGVETSATAIEELEEKLKAADEREASLRAEIQDLQEKLKEAKQQPGSFADYNRQLYQRSAEKRGEKKRLATAVVLALSMRGKAPCQIAEILEERGFGSTGGYISRLLSIKDKGDKERLMEAMSAHPEEFEGLTEADFESWFDERYKKIQISAEKRLFEERLRAKGLIG